MKYDVTIVGGGPSGSTAAKFLSDKGIKTLLIDKSRFPRFKPCGGGIPMRLLDRFEYLKNTDLIESYSYGGYAYSPSLKYKLELIDEKPLVAMILRQKFDHGLIKLAEECGTTIFEGKNVVDMKISKDNAKIFLDDGKKIDSEIVIGADGVWSTVAKKTGLLDSKRYLAVCVLKEYKLDEETVGKYFGNTRCGHLYARFENILGYGWIFPKKEHINIGIGSLIKREDNSKIKVNLLDFFKGFIDRLKKQKMIPDNLKTDNIKGGALPLYPLKKTYCNRAILVGDAAGVINPLTGEGIYYAMSSGEIAADVIAEAIKAEDASENFLSKYQTNWRKDFGEDLDILSSSLNVKQGQSTEKYFKIASKDRKLTELLIRIMTGQISIKENKYKVARRLVYASIKSPFSKN